jgi:hypothetical protein
MNSSSLPPNGYDIAYHAAGTSTIRILNYDRAGTLTAQLKSFTSCKASRRT